MTRAWIRLGILLVVLPLLASLPVFAQANRLGTWKLNLAKSKYEGSSTAPKSETRTYTAAPDGAFAMTSSVVLADGSAEPSSYTAKYDGKAYPYKGTAGDSISIKSVDANTLDATLTRAGKMAQTVRSTVSRDGKTMTFLVRGTNATGAAYSATRIYDKQ